MRTITLTFNPALDKSTAIDRLAPAKKLRCSRPQYDAGGGGINVARALNILGSEAEAWYIAGGAAGDMIDKLLQKQQVTFRRFPCEDWTRENLMVMEDGSGEHYRFVFPGQELVPDEWHRVLEALENVSPRPEYLIASGSLPQGVPEDLYKAVGKICKSRQIKLILDTSGEPLKSIVGTGAWLLKPNLGELASLTGQESISQDEQEKYAQQLIDQGACEVLVLSMGPRGAMLKTKDELEYITPPTVKTASTVGAGDSMVAGIMYGLQQGWELAKAVRFGVAAGTAATKTPATELCRKDDTFEIFQWMQERQ